jgi:hypothetical protein
MERKIMGKNNRNRTKPKANPVENKKQRQKKLRVAAYVSIGQQL